MGRSLVLTAILAMACLAPLPRAARPADPEIVLVIESNRFTPEEIKVKASAPFVQVVTNKDKGPEEFGSHDLRIEKVIPAGRTVRVTIPALEAGTYGFVGEYRAKTAKGRIVAD